MSVSVAFWGARGSIPSPGPDTVRYGGNTPCVYIRTPSAKIILDAGSGIRSLGQHLMKTEGASGHTITLLISHTHWDHIQGLPFFAPAFIPGNRVTIAGPEIFNPGFEKVIAGQMTHSYFPLRIGSLGATISFRELTPGVYDDLVPDAIVRTLVTNHPVVDLAYRIETHGRAIVYLMDHECWTDDFASLVRNSPDANMLEIEKIIIDDLCGDLHAFLQGADLVIADAAYSPQEYATRRGWGHSTHEQMYDLVEGAGVKRLAFFHHEPNRTDAALEEIEKGIQSRNARDPRVAEVFAAREGMQFELD